MPSDIEAPPTDLATRLQDLLASLDELGPHDALPSVLAQVFNDLLRQAKAYRRDGAVHGMDPVSIGRDFAQVDTREIRRLVLELISVTAASPLADRRTAARPIPHSKSGGRCSPAGADTRGPGHTATV